MLVVRKLLVHEKRTSVISPNKIKVSPVSRGMSVCVQTAPYYLRKMGKLYGILLILKRERKEKLPYFLSRLEEENQGKRVPQ